MDSGNEGKSATGGVRVTQQLWEDLARGVAPEKMHKTEYETACVSSISMPFITCPISFKAIILDNISPPGDPLATRLTGPAPAPVLFFATFLLVGESLALDSSLSSLRYAYI